MFRMTVAYVGTGLSGWQVQPRGETVQGACEHALKQVFRAPVKVTGASRTDAGVHALGQVAHFSAPASLSCESLRRALNALLPGQIRIERLTRARPGFHARHDARGKVYRYRLGVERKPSPFTAAFLGALTGPPPDVAKMRAAGSRLVGRRDFSAFCGAGAAVQDAVRTLSRVGVRQRGDEIVFEVEGGGFLRHQVRNLVGTLIEVGQGKRTAASLRHLLASRDRRLAGPTAPASGLCLVKVRYTRGETAGRRRRDS